MCNDSSLPDLEFPSPFILMVDRGGCTFVKKVRHAQHAGAAGVIIADNTCLCRDPDCTPPPPPSSSDDTSSVLSCETSEPIMADDGSGSDISIPTFLVFKRDADVWKDRLSNNQPVQVEMQWSLPISETTVQYELWTSPGDALSRNFLSFFQPMAQALAGSAYFTPHYHIYDGIRAGCSGGDNNNNNACPTLCTNNGRYCATDPDGDLDHGISGADVVTESLRRICIWNYYGSTTTTTTAAAPQQQGDGVGNEFWEYNREFLSECDNADNFSNNNCIRSIYETAKIDGTVIERCMKDSGGLEGDVPNSKLELEIKAEIERGIVIIPTASVNQAAIRGVLTVNTVFDAICAGFSSPPPICTRCQACPDPEQCVLQKPPPHKKGVCPTQGGGGGGSGGGGDVVGRTTVLGSTLLLSGIFAGMYLWQQRRNQMEVRDEVRGILAEYMPLEDKEAEEDQML
mmetsp:Transcript_21028/g.31727  ORF Transcript_21028/g.31727 Transcript_21028/m.31727 type:complete len:457 (-) Transcript_21028:105-1475(-)